MRHNDAGGACLIRRALQSLPCDDLEGGPNAAQLCKPLPDRHHRAKGMRGRSTSEGFARTPSAEGHRSGVRASEEGLADQPPGLQLRRPRSNCQTQLNNRGCVVPTTVQFESSCAAHGTRDGTAYVAHISATRLTRAPGTPARQRRRKAAGSSGGQPLWPV